MELSAATQLFQLVIQMEWQREMFLRFGQDLLLVDATHKTATHDSDVRSVTAMVGDERQEGKNRYQVCSEF